MLDSPAISELVPYPAYQDSGVEWLGKIPQQWKVRRFKYILREQDSRSSTGTEQLLRVSQYTGVTQRLAADGSDEPDTRAKSLVGYKRVSTQDLAVNIMLAWNGSLGISPFDGIVSPAYCVYRFGPAAHPWFFHYLLRSPAYKSRIKAVSTGIVESRLRLYTDDLFRLEALLPPPEEQATIVRFLNHVDGRIRRYIRAKRQLISLLNEQKQAVINRAVTKGLDSNVRLKSSGVEWVSEIPDKWKIVAIKRILSRMDYGTSESLAGEGEVRVLTMGHIQDGEVTVPDKGSLDVVPADLFLEHDDLLFNRTNSPDLVGKVGIFRGHSTDRVSFASYLVRLRTNTVHSPEWLNYLLNSSHFWAFARSHALISLHQANLNSTRYG